MAILETNFASRVKNLGNPNDWKLRSRKVLLSVFRFLDYPHISEVKTSYNNGGNFLNRGDNYLFLPEVFSAKKHISAEFVSLAAIFYN